MRKREPGRGMPMVSTIGLGCMRFGGVFGATDEAASQRCRDAAIDARVTFPDTANIYGKGLCAEVMARFFKLRRVAVTVATKAAIVDGGARRFDNSDAQLRAEREGSLKRMGWTCSISTAGSRSAAAWRWWRG